MKTLKYVPLRCAPDVDWPKAGERLRCGDMVTIVYSPPDDWRVRAVRSARDALFGPVVADVDEGDQTLILCSNLGGDDTTIWALVDD